MSYGSLTPDQQAALKEIVLATAAPIAELEPSWRILWGVDLSEVNPDSISKKQAVVFLKFLRAREFRVADAKDMLVSTLNWRKEFDIHKLKDEKFSAEFNALGLIYGEDKNGKPITYNFYGSIGQEEIYNNPDKFLRWRIQIMEQAIDLLDFENGKETITQVHDYEGASLFMDKRLKAVSTKIIKLFQDHYPEMLEKKFFIAVPTLMEYLFSLFSSFVSKATRDKFIVVSKARTRATLLEHIAPNQLPSRYGGFDGSADTKPEDEIHQITVKARGVEKVEIPIVKGATAAWEFAVLKDDIAVSARVENAQGEVVESDGDKEAVRADGGKGKIVAGGDGTFVISFDNSYSLVTDKTVLYRASIHA